jgi:Asp-tRNA(Asn)/Glu-tRNA(Gln) amidotransferase A subunit family amidase
VKSAEQIAREVRGGVTTATAELETSLERIHERNEQLNVFLYIDEEGARAAAGLVVRTQASAPLLVD